MKCPECGVGDVPQSRKLCNHCRGVSYYNRQQTKRSSSGLCMRCGEPAITGLNKCQECRDGHTRKPKMTRYTKHQCDEFSICNNCRSRKRSEGYLSCEQCRNKRVNKEKKNARDRARRMKLKEQDPQTVRMRHRAATMKCKYGITIDEYNAMIKEQGGVCKICQELFVADHKKYVDHDHKTGVVRGVLCPRCNTLVGFIEKGGDLVEKATMYISGEFQND